ncbi:teneurin-m isoform X1 [Drosophila nasuta]|uniref:teneurin-m isoform X1 n=1 Tax=Drosophila nasuta TaxID=42062 RepID=UPI00295EE4B8|nr:teneurin-m isoform X1 [Drosophila nasuta]
MNPYEYESTLDCRDTGGGPLPHSPCPGTLPMTGRHLATGGNGGGGSHSQTLQHQNQQNLQVAAAAAAAAAAAQQSSSHYDYEYQHLPHRPPDNTAANLTAQRTHGRQGFLLEGVTPTAPPDVPPRNPTMSRMNNARLIAGAVANNPNDLGVDFEPSCLVRTPSGNVYIPSGNININKGSPIDYKSGSACSTPTKDTLKGGYERSTQGCPVLPPRSMNGMPTHHYSAPMNFRKDLPAWCSANWLSIVAFSAVALFCIVLILLTSTGKLSWSPTAPCTVLVGNEAAEVTAAKSTNTDLSKLHNASVRAKNGQGIGIIQGQGGGSGGGGGTSTATVTTATSNSGTAQGLQSTSASAEATSSAAAATATSSSQSSLAPSTSLSSSLANANNGASRQAMSTLLAVNKKVAVAKKKQRRQRRDAATLMHWHGNEDEDEDEDEAEDEHKDEAAESFSDLITSPSGVHIQKYLASTAPRMESIEKFTEQQQHHKHIESTVSTAGAKESNYAEAARKIDGILNTRHDDTFVDDISDYDYGDDDDVVVLKAATTVRPAPKTRQQFGKSLNGNLAKAGKMLAKPKRKLEQELMELEFELKAETNSGDNIQVESDTEASSITPVIDEYNQSDSGSASKSTSGRVAEAEAEDEDEDENEEGSALTTTMSLGSDNDDIVEINTSSSSVKEIEATSTTIYVIENDFQIKQKLESESEFELENKPVADDNNNERDLADNYEQHKGKELGQQSINHTMSDLMLSDAAHFDNEDIDIVKLDEAPHSNEVDVYKMAVEQPAKAKPLQAPAPPPPPPTSENEVLKEQEQDVVQAAHLTPLKPYVSERIDQPGKRILVNLTIATDDGSDSIYTLHVAVPTGGGSHNVEQLLTHEHRQLEEQPSNNIDNVGSCLSEPPPRMPDCPCSCLPPLPVESEDNELDIDSMRVENANDNVEEDHVNDIEMGPLASTTAAPPATTTNSFNETATDNATDVVTDRTAEQFACPDVMPILILEGARTFPARSFPPDGTTFGQITLGQKLTKEIQPYSYWNMQFYQSEPAYVKFDYTIPRGASIGVYGRRNALPTHTQYHFKEVLSGFSVSTRTARAAHLSITREVTRYMEPGHWFVSLYNDDGDVQELTFYAAIAEDMTQNCPNGCSGNGQCLLGHCQCNPGFGGDDCSESVCPVLCSQHGDYTNGECICNPGWKGKECSLRHDECEVADCNGHGHCVSGKCQCMRGYKGKFCEEVDCPHPNCSGHGFCADGTCICKKGWKGVDCATMDQDALQCLPDCSGHGTFDLDTQTCTCESKWSGDDCSKELCDLDCGQHGRCEGDACACDPEWGGDYCNTRLCDSRCNEHGQCKNGTCLCVTGWNGKHCTIEGCPNSCAAHGQCRVSGEGQWECRCYEGWDGPDCGIALELNCGDSKDNDKDGLVDCEDPECCASHVCKNSQLCVSAPKPIDVLLRKQPPAITASFFERMKFLIDESSLQNYAKLEAFNESIFWNYFNASRSAVIRGRVVTSLGMGLVGVRVSTTTVLEGFTLTRDDGWFDLMVNGGGAVTLQFGRAPFRPQSRIVQVPWNEVVIIDVMVMSMSDEKALATTTTHTCFSHDYDQMKPVVLASWKHGFQGACPDRSAILAESQVIQESLQIPGTGLNLVYHSSRAAGYLSTIKLQLTPDTIPATLHLIHLRITIEGILFERVFEADPGIKFTYAWNRLNIYRQRVYGVTTAVVKVGYQYTDCKDIVWDIQTTKLSGHDMSISEVGGWNLDIHHRYNFHEGILQKGDGSNIYLRNKPRIILTTMGDGHQRPLECQDCDGYALKQRLLAPVALAAAPDGSLFVGDFNYIRRIMTDGTIRTVVKLNATRVSYRYHMALSPLDGTLYISDPESHQIIRVRNMSDYDRPEQNWEPVVGSGERCLPGDEAHCGDGALAKDAKLAYPKGIAISSDNILYFADGTNIRMVDRDGIVSTLIGNHMHKSHWKPIPCEGTLKLEEMHLRWPTELAVSPMDNTLHIIDDHMILRMTPDGRVRVISGRVQHCATASTVYDAELATHATLVMPQSIAFGPLGELFVAESDSQRINRVRVIGTDGRIASFAGAESKCNCLERGCDCFEADHYLATSAKFNTIAALAVTPDGHVHIADQANYRIRSVMSSIPEASPSREYEIYAPDMQEIYIFNRFGQHVSTRNILTGETTYVFTYNVNTSNGKLSTVTDAAGNKVFLLRDYTSQVNSIENTKGQKCRLRMTRMKMLHELSTPDNYNVTYEYHGPTGLLKTKLDSTGRSYVYNYDEFGRLTSAVTPTGRVIELTFDLSVKGAQVKVSENAQKEISMLIQGSTVVVKNGAAESRTTVGMDGSTTSITPWGHNLQMEVMPYTILAEQSPLLGESYPVPAKQRTEIAGDLANRFEWRYFVRRQQPLQPGKQNKGAPRPVTEVGRKLRVNGDNVLTLEYDRETQSVVVMVDDKQELLNVTYDRTSRPVSFRPQSGDYADVDLEYDRFGRLVSWKWGVLQEAYTFDRNGRLNEIKYGDGSSMVYTFKDMFGSLPLKVTTPRRSDYLLQYDDAGALQSLTTPRGHIHSFSLQTSLGFFKYQYYSPINRHPFEILYNDEGQILAKIHPHQSGKVAFVHDAAGRLETILAGLFSTHYTYQESTSLVKSVEVQEPGFELRREFKYHAGILKDEKLRFGSKNSLSSAHYKYAYDGNARLSGIEMAIDDKELPTTRYKYSQNLGQLEVVQDLKITRNAFNRTVIQDSAKQFFTIVDYDQHGRVKSVLMNIKSFDVFRLELDYDLRNRIKSQKTTFGRSTAFDKINYNADGHVIEVLGTNNWKYLYDENGNTVGIVDQGEKINLGYDIGDRVIKVGDIEFNNYDARGFVVRRGEQKYRYNNRGQLIHAFERDRFQSWYYYDDRSRLVAWHDSKGNVTQYFYANPKTPNLVSHVHFPEQGKTMKFYYDDRDMLIALEHAEQRYYVATDQNGSPLAFFDMNGGIVKEVKRTPFGRTIKDTKPDFFVPIDFHGGLIDPHTKLIYTERRQYDPTVGQWMTPLWETLATEMSNPTDVFIYRYHNNDPINRNKPQDYMIDLDAWLRLFGYELNNMQSNRYTKLSQYTPQASIKSNTLAPDFGVISGLECIVEKTNEKFSDFDFAPKPLLKMEPKMRNLLPRVSYRRAVFGEGVLLSRIGGRALVSVVDGSNSVVQDVVSSVFNNSYFLDLHFSIHDQDVFYFVKDNVLKLRDDNEELRRLGGMFNISTHEISDHGGSAAKELRLHGPEAVVIIKYGVDPEQERHRILKHAHKRAVERAWELEKQLVAAGFQGRGDWTEEEKEELIQHGDVDGWIGIDIHSIHKYPQLADDPGNVAFQRDAKRKRRKSGNSHRMSSNRRQQQKYGEVSA